ncbi:MAG: hypothetical protein KF858_08600 [Candidatus Sumerlaeia bacterium]|nr:hypothetical protein [Candidatus Sumerlaeia bacterium]
MLHPVHAIPGQSGLSVVRLLPDGEAFLVGLLDGTLRLFDTESRTVIRTLDGSGPYLQDVAVSPDGSSVIVGYGSPAGRTDLNVAMIRDLTSGATVREFVGHSNWVVRVAYSPDGSMVVTGSNDGTARLWSADTGTHLRTLSHGGEVHSVGFTRFGTEVLTASGTGARLWDASSGNSIWNAPTAGAYYLAAGALSPSSRFVATVGLDGYCRLLDIGTGTLAKDWFFSVEGASGVFYSAGDSRLLTADLAMTYLWDTQQGSKLAVLEHSPAPTTVAFSPDGRLAVTGSWDDLVLLWNLPAGAGPDIYEGEPYLDNSPDTRNEIGTNSARQDHTLHEVADEDWGIADCWSLDRAGQIAATPHELAFEEVFVPPGISLMVEVYRNRRPEPEEIGTSCVDSTADECILLDESGYVSWLTSGTQMTEKVWWRVRSVGGLVPVGEEPRYSVKLWRTAGVNNGIVASVGTIEKGAGTAYAGMIRFGLDREVNDHSLATITGMRVLRFVQPLGGLADIRLVGDDFLPEPSCSSCNDEFVVCGGQNNQPLDSESCFQIVDDLSSVPGIGPGTLVAYIVQSFREDEEGLQSEEEWAWGAAVVGSEPCSLAVPPCLASEALPRLALSPALVERRVVVGHDAIDETITLTNVGAGTLQFTTLTPSWASVVPESGNVTGELELSLSFSTADLAPGTYLDAVRVFSGNADNSPQQVPLVLTVEERPRIGLSTASIVDSVIEGEDLPDRSLMLSNLGGGVLEYETQTPAWISVAPASGSVSEEVELTLSFATRSLGVGVHIGAMVTTSLNADNSPQEVLVQITVQAPPPARGDVDGSGQITPLDAQLAFECWLWSLCPDGADATAANVCHPESTGITPADAQGIFELYLGIEPACVGR